MLDIFSAYATDENLEENGVWFDLTQGAKVLVARGTSTRYLKLLAKLTEANRAIIDLGTKQSDDKWLECVIEAMANGMLLGWEGISFKGEVLPYSVDNAKKLLALKDFRRTITEFANTMDRYRATLETAQGEASGSSSDGS